MRRATERRHTGWAGPGGFALVLVLGLLAVTGLVAAGALGDALFAEALVGTRSLQLRAFVLSDEGLGQAMAIIGQGGSVAEGTRELRPSTEPMESVVVGVHHLGGSALPAGYSGARFTAERYVIESTGRTARGTRAVQVQGVTRVLPAIEQEEEP